GRYVDAAQQVEECRFPAAGRSSDGDVLAGGDADRHVADRFDRASGHRETAAELARLEDDHEITSRRRVSAIGSTIATPTGYAAARRPVTRSSAACSTRARGSNTKKWRRSGRPGIRLRMPSSRTANNPPSGNARRPPAPTSSPDSHSSMEM